MRMSVKLFVAVLAVTGIATGVQALLHRARSTGSASRRRSDRSTGKHAFAVTASSLPLSDEELRLPS